MKKNNSILLSFIVILTIIFSSCQSNSSQDRTVGPNVNPSMTSPQILPITQKDNDFHLKGILDGLGIDYICWKESSVPSLNELYEFLTGDSEDFENMDTEDAAELLEILKNDISGSPRSDLDEDGISNADECAEDFNIPSNELDRSVVIRKLDPFDDNTDDDDMGDACELKYWKDNNYKQFGYEMAISHPLVKNEEDFDGDSISNDKECEDGTNPFVYTLTDFSEIIGYDADCMGDDLIGLQSHLGLNFVSTLMNPLYSEYLSDDRYGLADLDLDFISNEIECSESNPGRTDPFKSHTDDGDDLSDACEYEFYIEDDRYGTNPAEKNEPLPDCANCNENDFDGDGFSNNVECGLTKLIYTNPITGSLALTRIEDKAEAQEKWDEAQEATEAGANPEAPAPSSGDNLEFPEVVYPGDSTIIQNIDQVLLKECLSQIKDPSYPDVRISDPDFENYEEGKCLTIFGVDSRYPLYSYCQNNMADPKLFPHCKLYGFNGYKGFGTCPQLESKLDYTNADGVLCCGTLNNEPCDCNAPNLDVWDFKVPMGYYCDENVGSTLAWPDFTEEDLSRDYYESLSFGGPSDGGVTLQPGDSYCGDSSACIIGESCDCPECTPDCGDNLACNDGVCDTHNAQSAVGAAAGTTPAEDDANAGNTVDTSGLIDPDSIIIPEVISDELLLEHFNIDCLDIEDVETEFIAFVEIAEKLYDLDGDTVPNDVECNVGLNPLDINSDNDQLNDACEYKFNGYEGFNLAGEEEPIEFLGLDDDYDGDGDTNEEECGKSDEILDPFEIYQYTNPLEPTFMTFDLETFCVREFEQLGGGDIDTIIGMVSNEEQVKDLDEDEVPNLVECSNGMLVGNSYFSNYQSQRTDESGADRGEIVNYFTTNPFMINTDGDVFNDACEYEFSDEGDFSTKPIEEDGVVTISNPVLGIIDYEMGFPDDYDGDGKSNADECGPSNSLNPPDVSEYTNPVAIELEQFEMEGCNDGEEFKFEDRTILIEPTYEFFSNILGLIEVADATTDGSPELIIEARKDLDLDLVSSKIECSLDVEPYTLNAERLLDELTEIIYPRKTSPLSSDTDGDDLTDTCEYEFYFIDENIYSTDPGIITTANEDEGGVDSDHPENGALLDNFDGDDWTNIEECGPEMDREDYTNPGGSDMEGSNIENLATQDSTIEQLSGSPYGTDIGVDKNFLDATYYCKYDSDNAPLRVYDFTLRRNEELINLNSDDPEQNRENSIRGKGEELRLVKGMYACSADGLRIETCGEVGDVQTKNEITCLSGTRCFGPPSLNYDPDFYDDEKIFGPSCMKVNAENPWCEHTVSDVRSSVDKSIAETVTYFTPPGYFITPTETTYIKCKGSGEWGRETNCHDSTQRASELYQFQGRETPCMDVCDANTPMAGADSVDFNPDTAVFDGTSFNFGETRCGENQRGESVAVVCHQYGNQISVPGGNHEDLKYTDWRYAEAGTCEIFDTQCVYDYNFQLGRYAARCTCPDLPAKVKELVDGVNDIDSEWYENIDVSKSEELKDMDLDALHQVFNYPEKSYYRFAIPGDEKTPESNCPYWCDLSYYNNHEYGDGTLQRIEHMDDGGPKDDALVTRDFVLYGRSICNPGNSQQIVTCRMRDKGQGIGLVGTTTNGLSADKQCTGGLYTGGKVGTDINQPKLECTNIKPDVEPGFPSAKVARVTNDNCKFCAKGSVGYYGAIGDIAVKNYEQYECQDSGTSASWVKTVAWGLSLPEGVKRLIEAEFTTYSEGVGQRLSVAKYHHSNDVWCYSYDARYELLQSGCTTQETCENAISSMANADKYVLLEDLSCGTLDTSISDGAYQLGSASIDDAKDAVFQCYAAKEKGKDRKYGWANLLGIDTDNNICGQQQYCDSTGGTFTCKDY